MIITLKHTHRVQTLLVSLFRTLFLALACCGNRLERNVCVTRTGVLFDLLTVDVCVCVCVCVCE